MFRKSEVVIQLDCEKSNSSNVFMCLMNVYIKFLTKIFFKKSMSIKQTLNFFIYKRKIITKMKKLFLFAAVCAILTACNNKPAEVTTPAADSCAVVVDTTAAPVVADTAVTK